ncbi:MAG: hypothetical protein EU551_04450 [Promethearchaeota archaeon]|nr:MAG: hypothetical protein EU551_04450 [Candidatus Lokiarchaeota archaeon]
MIEVLDPKEKVIGYIEGKDYLDKKKRRIGWFDEDNSIVRDKNNYPLLIIDEKGIISYNDGEQVGYLKENKIFFYDDSLIYKLVKDEGKILQYNGDVALILKGEISKLNGLDFFGICSLYLELFS